MRTIESPVGYVLLWLLLLASQVSAEPLRFIGPFGIPDVPRPVTVHAGDLDGNGKLDLIASSGRNTVLIYFQEADDRNHWTLVPLRVGASTFFARAGDFDNDGFDDLAVADGGSTTYYVRSRGDRTFDPPIPLRQSRGSRWIALGDWDNDGFLDLASSNLSSGTLTIFVGDGQGNFTLTGSPPSTREHTLEAFDYDGDGFLDLALGTGIPGIQLHRGNGDGTFTPRGTVPGHNGLLGCVEYISVGDFNNDGLDDLAPTCIDDQVAYAGISIGNGRFTRILRDPFAPGTESSAIGDLNGDGNQDLALVSHGSTLVRVYPGNGDGTFQDPVHFGSTGAKPVFLIAEDLDRDGRTDIVSADEASSSLTIFFGQAGEHFLASNRSVGGYGTARAYAVTDWDKDGVPDFVYASNTASRVHVYLKPGLSSPSSPDVNVTISQRYNVMDVADLNGDGIMDLVGGSTGDDALYTAILDAEGNATQEAAFPCDANPKQVEVALLDEGSTPDILALCASGSDGELLAFHGVGDGTFEAAPHVATIERPKLFDTGDIDRDGRTDFAVLSSKAIAIHYALEGGGYSEPAALDTMEVTSLRDVKVVDVDGDGLLDVLAGDSRLEAVLVYRGTGTRVFGAPVVVETGLAATVVEAVDVDEDGRIDLAVGHAASQSVAFLYGLEGGGYSEPHIERAGAPMGLLRIIDANADGVNDIVAFGATTTGIILGERAGPPPAASFRRGDGDGDGRVGLTDAVVILNHLFRGDSTVDCLDAADINDDGTLNLTDPVGLLNYLFQGGGQPPAAPGPATCGEDPTDDGLADCRRNC